MSEGYRITVRGVMSERFCRGFPGLNRSIDADRTVLSADPRSAVALPDLLATLGNLGLEVVEIEQPPAADPHIDPED